jgi:hypothetical protein
MNRVKVELSKLVTTVDNFTYLELIEGKGLELFDYYNPAHPVLLRIRDEAERTGVEPMVTIIFSRHAEDLSEGSERYRFFELYVADDADLEWERKLDVLRVRNI